MKKIALVDADGIAYKIAATNDELDSFEGLTEIIDEYVNFILSTTESSHALFFIKGAKNFRKEIATIKPYKGNRIPKRIKWLEPCYYILETRYRAIAAHGAEADDYIASAVKYFQQLNVPYIICSHDKDLKQIQGEHLDLNEFDIINITEQEAAYRLFFQIMTGDSSDNIQGIPKIGPKTAEKILAEVTPTHDGYLLGCINTYKNVYGDNWPQYFAENYRLVHLKTDINLDMIEDGNIFKLNG